MTALQQTCDDMLHAQYQQQRLCSFECGMFVNRFSLLPGMYQDMRLVMGINAAEIRRCQSLLANSTAANDEPTSGEAA